MDENADANHAIFEPPPENWRRPPGRPRTIGMKNIHDDLSPLDLEIHEARDLAQNRPLGRHVFAQRYALVLVHATVGRYASAVLDTAHCVFVCLSVSALCVTSRSAIEAAE